MPKTRSETFLELIYYELKDFGKKILTHLSSLISRIDNLENTPSSNITFSQPFPSSPTVNDVNINPTNGEFHQWDGTQWNLEFTTGTQDNFEQLYTGYIS